MEKIEISTKEELKILRKLVYQLAFVSFCFGIFITAIYFKGF